MAYLIALLHSASQSSTQSKVFTGVQSSTHTGTPSTLSFTSFDPDDEMPSSKLVNQEQASQTPEPYTAGEIFLDLEKCFHVTEIIHLVQ